MTEDKWNQMEKDFSWDDDPLVFIFHKEQPEKVKMMTHRLNMKNWIQMDKTYPGKIYIIKLDFDDNKMLVIMIIKNEYIKVLQADYFDRSNEVTA